MMKIPSILIFFLSSGGEKCTPIKLVVCCCALNCRVSRDNMRCGHQISTKLKLSSVFKRKNNEKTRIQFKSLSLRIAVCRCICTLYRTRNTGYNRTVLNCKSFAMKALFCLLLLSLLDKVLPGHYLVWIPLGAK